MYRKLFHLSSKQMAEEPADAVILSFEIEKFLQEKQEREINNSSKE